MNENKSVAAFQSVPVVAELNRVKGFDPARYIRIARDGGLMMELKYKKLWFRLACPNGRIKPVVMQITEKQAVVEAQVYRNASDAEPIASFLSTRYADGPDGRRYVAAAQYEAEDQALGDAGFGVQFCDIFPGTALDRLVSKGAISFGQSVTAPVTQPQVVAQQPIAAVTPASIQQPVAAPPPVAELPVVAEQPVAAPPPAAELPAVVEQPVAAPPPVAEPPVVAEQPAAASPTVSSAEPIPFPAGEGQQDSPYTKDMSVEDICQIMTTEDALALNVDVGTCKGWTMAQVQEKRRASLKWYLNGYNGDNNILRAAAFVLLNGEQRLQDAG